MTSPTDDISLHDRLLNEWGMAIIGGAIAPGDRLPEPVISDGGAPSRTPAHAAPTRTAPSRSVTREVTRVLESMGLVTVRRKAGATVNSVDMWNVFDPQVIRWRLGGAYRLNALNELSQLRAAVEPMAARLAAAAATPKQWGTLTEAAVGMVSHADRANESAYLNADMRFHRTLLEASGNLMFAALGDVVASTLEGRTAHELMPSVANQEALDLHVEVAALIRRGDGAGAEAAMRRIVDESADAITRIAAGN